MSETLPPLNCYPDADPDCALTCTGLEACEACGCVIEDTGGGPWGKAMDVIMCLLPILFLLFATLKPNPLPTTQSLPLAALMMYLIRLMYLGSDPLLCSAAIISGLHEALSPLTIMAGAILLFDTMEATLCMPYMMREMKLLTQGHMLADLLLIFNFAYMVEGASGFGTPAALGAPMLASMGYGKFEAVVMLLLMNTFATVWGAAGTPIWFGFGSLDPSLSEDELLEVSYKAAIALAFAAFLLIPTMVLSILCPFKAIWSNKLFVLLSLASSIGPNVGLSFVTYEMPSLLGGMIGSALTVLWIRFKVGLRPIDEELLEEKREKQAMDTDGGGSSSNKVSAPLRFLHLKKNKEEVSLTKEESLAMAEAEAQASAVGPTFEENDEMEDSNVDEETPLDGPNHDDIIEDVEVDREKNGDAPTLSLKEELQLQDDLPGSRRAAAEDQLGPRKEWGDGFLRELVLRTFPLWGTVIVLVVTRIPAIGLRDILTRKEPNVAIYLRTYGTYRISASLVLQLQNILTYPNVNWKYELLYVPFILPFVIVSLITMFMFRKDLQHSVRDIFGGVMSRLRTPAIALMGALVLVQLLTRGGSAAPATIIGINLSDALAGGWVAVAALLGTLGSFFSGSTTVSNLTFGGIQQIASENIGISTTALLALQAAGASAGNGVCLNNIIAACAVVGLHIGEGKVIARTWKPVLLFCIIATVVMLAFFIRF